MVVGEAINNIMSGIENTGNVRLHNHRKKLKQRYDIIKKLGQGTYGKVQLGINKETGQEVAIKTIKKCKIETDADLIRIRREIQIMSSVQHPNIIHIYEVFENREKMILVMEYAAGGELYDYLSEKKVLTEEEARRIFRQVAIAVYYCHKHKICHRDLKLENILLDQDGNAKIADFGLSNVFDGTRLLATFCGSPLYASPEIVKGTPYRGPEVDCWSLGVLLYTLVYGAMPFDGSHFKRLVKQISAGDYFEPKKASKASPLIREMLTVEASERADMTKVCSHWWVNEGYDTSCLDIGEYYVQLTPVRLDLLLSLAPPPPQVGDGQLVIANDQNCSNDEERATQPPTRSISAASIMETPHDDAKSPKRKLEVTASVENARDDGVAKRKDRSRKKDREKSVDRAAKSTRRHKSVDVRAADICENRSTLALTPDAQESVVKSDTVTLVAAPVSEQLPLTETIEKLESMQVSTENIPKIQESRDLVQESHDLVQETKPPQSPPELESNTKPSETSEQLAEPIEKLSATPAKTPDDKRSEKPEVERKRFGANVESAKVAFERRASLTKPISTRPLLMRKSMSVDPTPVTHSTPTTPIEAPTDVSKQRAVNIIANAIGKSKSRPSLDRKPPVPFGAAGRSVTTNLSDAISDVRSVTLPRRRVLTGKIAESTMENGMKSDVTKPREHIIPIQLEEVSSPPKTTQSTHAKCDGVARNAFVQSKSVSSSSGGASVRAPISRTLNLSRNLSRASQDSDTDSNKSSGAGEPIRKSAREYIIPIAVEGAGYVTPRECSVEPSDLASSTSSKFGSGFRFPRGRLSSRLSNDDDSGFNRPGSLTRDDQDSSRRDTFHKLRSSRPTLDRADSFSSGEDEDDDDDGFASLTAESLFSTLLSRVRNLTQQLNVDEDFRTSLPKSRLFDNFGRDTSSFWDFSKPLDRSPMRSEFSYQTHHVHWRSFDRSLPRSTTPHRSLLSQMNESPWRHSFTRRFDSSKKDTPVEEVLPLPYTDKDLENLKQAEKELSCLTPGLSRRIQRHLLAQLQPGKLSTGTARKLLRTLSNPSNSRRSCHAFNVDSPAIVNDDKSNDNKSNDNVDKLLENLAQYNLDEERTHKPKTNMFPTDTKSRPYGRSISLRETVDRSSYSPSDGSILSKYFRKNDSNKYSPDSSTSESYSSWTTKSTGLAQSLPTSTSTYNPASFLTMNRGSKKKSRFLRPDFYDTPAEESVYVKEKKSKEMETQRILKEIRDKRLERRLRNKEHLERQLGQIDGNPLSPLLPSSRSVTATGPDPINIAETKAKISRLIRPTSYPNRPLHSEIAAENVQTNEPSTVEESKQVTEEVTKNSEKKRSPEKKASFLPRKLFGFRSNSLRDQSRINNTITQLREGSVPPMDQPSTESRLIQRAVSIDNCSMWTTTLPQSPPPQGSIARISKRSVSKILSLFNRKDQDPSKTNAHKRVNDNADVKTNEKRHNNDDNKTTIHDGQAKEMPSKLPASSDVKPRKKIVKKIVKKRSSEDDVSSKDPSSKDTSKSEKVVKIKAKKDVKKPTDATKDDDAINKEPIQSTNDVSVTFTIKPPTKSRLPIQKPLKNRRSLDMDGATTERVETNQRRSLQEESPSKLLVKVRDEGEKVKVRDEGEKVKLRDESEKVKVRDEGEKVKVRDEGEKVKVVNRAKHTPERSKISHTPERSKLPTKLPTDDAQPRIRANESLDHINNNNVNKPEQRRVNHDVDNQNNYVECTTPTTNGDDPILDRIRRRSYYTRFNMKKPVRKSSLVGPGANYDYLLPLGPSTSGTRVGSKSRDRENKDDGVVESVDAMTRRGPNGY